MRCGHGSEASPASARQPRRGLSADQRQIQIRRDARLGGAHGLNRVHAVGRGRDDAGVALEPELPRRDLPDWIPTSLPFSASECTQQPANSSSGYSSKPLIAAIPTRQLPTARPSGHQIRIWPRRSSRCNRRCSRRCTRPLPRQFPSAARSQEFRDFLNIAMGALRGILISGFIDQDQQRNQLRWQRACANLTSIAPDLRVSRV